MDNKKFLFELIVIVIIAVVLGVTLAPAEEQLQQEDLYADATSHIFELDNITVDYYRGWMDACEYMNQQYIEEE